MYTWINASNGAIPTGSAANGNEANGESLFVARAFLNGGLHPGKIRGEFGAANIPFGGLEVKVAQYEVLINPGRWIPAQGGQIPDGAVKLGAEADGTPLYVARAWYQGGLHPGKVRPEFLSANIGFGGKEVKVFEYEVLIEN